MLDYVPIRESEIIERYGLPKDEVVAFRKRSLVEGKDWEREPQGSRPLKMCPLVYTEEGLKIVSEQFGVKDSKPAEPEIHQMLHAEVIRANYTNTRVMLVRLNDGKQVFCRVFDAKQFKPKLQIAVKYRSGRYFCEHRPTSILRINSLINRNTKSQ